MVPATFDRHDNHDIKEAERDNEDFVAEAIDGDPRHPFSCEKVCHKPIMTGDAL